MYLFYFSLYPAINGILDRIHEMESGNIPPYFYRPNSGLHYTAYALCTMTWPGGTAPPCTNTFLTLQQQPSA